ncbi:MAG: GNAT family N-acetyltransferase [Bacteroidota bacterium]
MAIQFRIIDSEEILSIVPLLYQLNDGNISEKTLETRTQEMVNQNYECLGIYDEEHLIGICGMWFQTRHYAGRSCEIDHVIIGDSHRNQGIGGKMMEFIYQYARKKECNWVELNTYVHNFPSHKFYNNQDFIAKGYHFIKDISSAS